MIPYRALLLVGLTPYNGKTRRANLSENRHKVPSHRTRIADAARHLSVTSAMAEPRARYSGSSRKLVVAFDIGTTFSGAAYMFLDPGQFPQIRSVTRPVLPPILDLVASVTNNTGTSTIRILGLQKFPLYYIMIATANSVASRMRSISGMARRMTMNFLG